MFGVVLGGNFVNLLSGTPFTASGGPGSASDAILGPCATFTGNGQICSIGGFSSGGSNSWVWAGVVRFNAFGAGYQTLGIGLGGSNTLVTVHAGVFKWFGAGDIGGLTLTAGINYFLIASVRHTVTTNFLILTATDLKTGIITSSTTSTGGGAATTGSTLYVGNNPADTTQFINGSMSHVMFSCNPLGAGLSNQQALAWAADPWSFWYAPANPSPVMSIPAGIAAQQQQAFVASGGNRIFRVRSQRWF